jgi:hypothetical protein
LDSSRIAALIPFDVSGLRPPDVSLPLIIATTCLKKQKTYSQTSRLENPEELQLHHSHEKFLFLTVLLLFAQCKMNYW